ncbi:(1S)-1,7-diacetoxy-luvungin A aldo-keto reductase-like [Primulina huaijiensis]|uniref:(1S)-1,7-diacetoxy-luvungin A aldo-keto reductase-like n=1 Tax=Primulina huaijiensis TaxID=1492673 RepID=UPI003CC74129
MTDASQGPFAIPKIKRENRSAAIDLPALGIGTSSAPEKLDPSAAKAAILYAIGLGYTHFQTEISSYLEQFVGEAIAEALQNGTVQSRDDFFITSKILFHDAASDSIVPNLKKSLQTLNLKSVDIFLIAWPENGNTFSINDFMLAWKAMEECYSLGLASVIGVGNFSTTMLESLLQFAKTAPAANQIGMERMWKDKKLREYCAENDITIVVSSSVDGEDKDFDYTQFMESEGLKMEKDSNLKTPAQVYFRWAYDQGVAVLLESLSEQLMKEMLNIFQ